MSSKKPARQRMRRRGRKGARTRNSVGGVGTQVVRNVGTNIVPLKMRTAMPYGYTWLNATAAPGFYDWVMKGNALNDPDVAVGGNSAYGLAEMAYLYDYYRVLGSTIKMTVVNLDATNPVNVIILPSLVSASYAAAQQDGLLRHPRARNILVDRYDGSKTLTHSMSTAVIHDVKDVDDLGFQALTNADPTHLWYWHVITFNNGGAVANCELKMEIIYDTVFSGPHAMTV